METILLSFFVAGALGSLAKDILEDGKLKLPKIRKDDFYLGFLGGMIIGGVAGYFIDGSIMTAFMGGYTGTALTQNLLLNKNNQTIQLANINETIIRKIAIQKDVDPELAVRVARCESSLDEKAIHLNTNGSLDRGLYQINSIWHPEVSEAEAFNPIFATHFFCKAFKKGHLDWWNATKKCWEK